MSQSLKQLPVPYLSKLQGTIVPGQTIFIRGLCKGNTRFDVNLHSGPTVTGAQRDDIALQLSFRIDDKDIILNSMQNNEWGKQISKKLNFKQGELFDVRIRAHEDKFDIFSNGKHVTEFDYRLPLMNISHIYVIGDCELFRCSWEGRYYPVPFQTGLPSQAMNPGGSLHIAGVVEAKAKEIEFNLMSGDDYPLHVNARFNEKRVVRNTRRGGAWDDVEERDGTFPFHKGEAFDFTITVEQDSFKLFVNNELFAEYRHRVPPHNINKLAIEGDVDLQGIHWD